MAVSVLVRGRSVALSRLCIRSAPALVWNRRAAMHRGWLTARGRRKWRLLRRKPVAFFQVYRRDVLLKVSPLPNPPWYTGLPRPSDVSITKAAQRAIREYLDTWRTTKEGHGEGSTDTTSFQEDTMTTVRNAAKVASATLKGDVDGNVAMGSTSVKRPESLEDTVDSVKQLGRCA